MFNLFKQKIDIKPNIRLMYSVQNKSFKVGGEIIVPENFVCLIYHNSKFYTSLDAGTHVVENSLCPKLFNKQLFKSKGKNKRISLICHYINLTPKPLKFKYKHKEFCIDYELISFKDFAEFILLYSYKTDDAYTEECLRDFALSNIRILNNSNLEILNNIFSKIGLKLNSVEIIAPLKIKPKDELDLLNSTVRSPVSKPSQPVATQAPKPSEVSSNLAQQQPQISQGVTCPNCGIKIKFSTTYCIKCGYKLK